MAGPAMSYRFDDIEIDAEGFRVTRGGEPVRLEPKAVELLLFLAGQPGRLVTKAEIQEAVWKDTAVTENALTRLVAQIRKGLGDDAREARYIETVPTRGYRFVARLADGQPAPAAPLPVQAAPALPRRRTGLRAAAATAAILVLALAAVAFRSLSRARPSATGAEGAGPVEIQVSTSDGLNVFPSFSPDASTLAYSTLRGGSMEIALRALAPGAREVFVTSDGQQNVQPVFSPDGRLLAYHSVGRGGIWVMPALGGAPRRLTTFGSSPSWSPDGSALVFQSQSWTGSTEGGFAAGEGSTLWVVPSAGGAPRAITSVEQTGPGGHGSAAWSPSGALIAFVAGGAVHTVRPDGTALRATSDRTWVTDVTWCGDGSTQIWTGTRRFDWYAWRVAVNPDTGEPRGEPEVLATGADRAATRRQPACSRDGKRVAYVTFRTWFEIMAQRVTGDGAPEGDPAVAVRGLDGRKQPPMYSPDGRRLAFGVGRPGQALAVWVADVDGGEPRLVAERGDLVATRSWFPDSRRIGLLIGRRQQRTFAAVDVDSGEITELRALDDPMRFPVLSPDGTRLAAHGPKDRVLNVWVSPVGAGPAVAVTSDTQGAGWPSWSPDGRTLAVELMRGGDTRVGVMPASGGPVRELTSAPGQSWPHSFSPDGSRLAFAGQRAGIWNIYSVPVDGGPERRLTSYTSPAAYVRYCDWSPRGDRIAYEYSESMSSVWVGRLAPR